MRSEMRLCLFLQKEMNLSATVASKRKSALRSLAMSTPALDLLKTDLAYQKFIISPDSIINPTLGMPIHRWLITGRGHFISHLHQTQE